jgi:hypothetical protein
MTRLLDSQHGSIGLWAGVVGAPSLWAVHLQLNYMLVPWVCMTHHEWVLHAVTIVSLIGSAWCVYLCSTELRRKDDPDPTASPANDRSRFTAMVGMMSSALFTLLILAQDLPTFFISPCWD